MKTEVTKRRPEGFKDHLSLALTTWGVGYLPGAPGTFGSALALLIYLLIALAEAKLTLYALAHGFHLDQMWTLFWAVNAILLTVFTLVGIWASSRSIPLLGNSDPSQAVVDELIGQFITFLFVPFGLSWPFILAGFLLFRLFDVWKPYPIDDLQVLPGGLGICADDMLAGVYAGICLAIIYAVYSFI